MRRLILGVVLSACVFPATASAQERQEPLQARVLYCADCVATPAAATPKPPFPLHGYIDSPDWRAVADYYIEFPISGWSLDCRDGQQPPFVAVLVKEIGDKPSRWVTSFTVERALSRPDVRLAYGNACPNIDTNDKFGYTVRVNEVLPPGVYSLAVFWTSGDGKSRSESRFVLVKP